MTTTTAQYTVLAANDGLRLQSGPGRDLVFKVTGEDTGGAFDYFTVEVAPHGGPPLHVHHNQEETIHVVNGRFKVRIGEENFELDEGGFAYLPSKVPHAFLNLTDAPAEIIVVYTPGITRRAFTSSASERPACRALGASPATIQRLRGAQRAQRSSPRDRHNASRSDCPCRVRRRK